MKVNVRKGDYGYSLKISNKDVNGEEFSTYMPVTFAKCEQPTDEYLRIDVSDCFLSCYKGKGGVVPKLVICDYSVIKVYPKFDANTKEETEVSEEELPF